MLEDMCSPGAAQTDCLNLRTRLGKICPRGYKMSMKFFKLIILKLLKKPNTFLLNMADHENFSANKYENANYCL